jgi:hypothetical protein
MPSSSSSYVLSPSPQANATRNYHPTPGATNSFHMRPGDAGTSFAVSRPIPRAYTSEEKGKWKATTPNRLPEFLESPVRTTSSFSIAPRITGTYTSTAAEEGTGDAAATNGFRRVHASPVPASASLASVRPVPRAYTTEDKAKGKAKITNGFTTTQPFSTVPDSLISRPSVVELELSKNASEVINGCGRTLRHQNGQIYRMNSDHDHMEEAPDESRKSLPLPLTSTRKMRAAASAAGAACGTDSLEPF